MSEDSCSVRCADTSPRLAWGGRREKTYGREHDRQRLAASDGAAVWQFDLDGRQIIGQRQLGAARRARATHADHPRRDGAGARPGDDKIARPHEQLGRSRDVLPGCADLMRADADPRAGRIDRHGAGLADEVADEGAGRLVVHLVRRADLLDPALVEDRHAVGQLAAPLPGRG